LYLPWAYELATRPAVLDAVEDLLGPNIDSHDGHRNLLQETARRRAGRGARSPA
jgi:hypothetical protein